VLEMSRAMKTNYVLSLAALLALVHAPEVRAEGEMSKAYRCARIVGNRAGISRAQVAELCSGTTDPQTTANCYALARIPVGPDGPSGTKSAGLGMSVEEAVALCKGDRE
jgi:hypothetical protein